MFIVNGLEIEVALSTEDEDYLPVTAMFDGDGNETFDVAVVAEVECEGNLVPINEDVVLSITVSKL